MGGRLKREGIYVYLQPTWSPLLAQLVKNLPAMQESCVGSLVWKDAPGEGKGYPLQYPCQENPMDRGAWRAAVHGVATSWTRLSD